LTLNLTTRCNMRCRYCAFSGRYAYKRTHGTGNMSFGTAKNAVDYFLKRSNGGREACIGFYGGEPLLRFDLMNQIFQYLKDIGKIEEFRYSITTNGTLLSTDIVRYLNAYDIKISILVSLDGPKQIHDRYRVFPNGGHTFDLIIGNLKKIKKEYPRYFNENIAFSIVLAPPYDFELVEDFFLKSSITTGLFERSTFSFVDPYGTTFFKDFKLDDEEKKITDKITILRERYKKALVDSKYENLAIEKKFFDQDFYWINFRPMSMLDQTYPPQGTCFPGKRKLFVNEDGNFFMCERVNSNYEIGNVIEGFNFKKIYQFLKKYEKFFKDCKYCWALRLCSKCFNSIRKGEDFNEERRNDLCKRKLNTIETNLKEYCEVREKNPKAFAPFQNIQIS